MLLFYILGCIFGPGPREQVPLADLAPLGEQGLAPLQAADHDVVVAQVLVEGAKTAVEKADARVESARRVEDAANLELEAARAELAAARAGSDLVRRGRAATAVEVMKRNAEAAEARRAWAEAALASAREDTDVADARLRLKRAQRELARVDLLRDARETKFARSSFVSQVEAARGDFDAATRKHDAALRREHEAYAEWQRADRRARAPTYERSWRPTLG